MGIGILLYLIVTAIGTISSLIVEHSLIYIVTQPVPYILLIKLVQFGVFFFAYQWAINRVFDYEFNDTATIKKIFLHCLYILLIVELLAGCTSVAMILIFKPEHFSLISNLFSEMKNSELLNNILSFFTIVIQIAFVLILSFRKLKSDQ